MDFFPWEKALIGAQRLDTMEYTLHKGAQDEFMPSSAVFDVLCAVNNVKN